MTLTAFPLLGITDMDIVQALLVGLVFLAWKVFRIQQSTLLQSAMNNTRMLEIANHLEALTLRLELKLEGLERSLESIEGLLMNNNATPSVSDFQAIVGKLESIESILTEIAAAQKNASI